MGALREGATTGRIFLSAAGIFFGLPAWVIGTGQGVGRAQEMGCGELQTIGGGETGRSGFSRSRRRRQNANYASVCALNKGQRRTLHDGGAGVCHRDPECRCFGIESGIGWIRSVAGLDGCGRRVRSARGPGGVRMLPATTYRSKMVKGDSGSRTPHPSPPQSSIRRDRVRTRPISHTHQHVARDGEFSVAAKDFIATNLCTAGSHARKVRDKDAALYKLARGLRPTRQGRV